MIEVPVAGRMTWTRGVNERVASDPQFAQHVIRSVARFNRGDWGDLDPSDTKMNDMAIKDGNRILAAYEMGRTSGTIWIIMEADRSVTTILFPDEY